MRELKAEEKREREGGSRKRGQEREKKKGGRERERERGGPATDTVSRSFLSRFFALSLSSPAFGGSRVFRPRGGI